MDQCREEVAERKGGGREVERRLHRGGVREITQVERTSQIGGGRDIAMVERNKGNNGRKGREDINMS